MNRDSRLYRELTGEELTRIAEKHFGVGALASAELLSGGLFNTTYRLTLSDGRRYVLRLGPVNRHLLMPFEHGMMQAEAHVYGLCVPAGVPVPEVAAVCCDREIVDRDYMLTVYIPSTPLSEAKEDAPDAYRATGRAVARMHAVTGSRFGRVSQILRGGGFSTWREAMLGEIRNWRSVAEPVGLYAAEEFVHIERAFRERAGLFDAVTVPHLVHADLWSGNLLIDGEGKLRAVIDADRALFGDPELEFASGWLDRPELWEGYGKKPSEDADSATRRRLYRLLYALLDSYVWKIQYCSDENSAGCKRAALDELDALEREG